MSPRYVLRFETGERQGETIPLTVAAGVGGAFTIGRKPGNSLQVVDTSVSGRHAELSLDGDTVVLRDLDSTNGTRVKGERVRTGALRHGDEFTLGNVHFVLLQEGAPTPVAAPPLPSLAPTFGTGALPVPGAAGLARTQVQPREDNLEITAADLARAKRGSRVGLIALGALAAVGGGVWFWLRGQGGEAERAAARPVTAPAGNLLGAGYSFEADAGYTSDDAAPSVFRTTRGARASGELGLFVELGLPREPEEGGDTRAAGGPDYAATVSDPARVRPGTTLSAEVSVRTTGAAHARLGLRFEGSGEVPPTPLEVLSDPIVSDGVHELFVFPSVVPAGYDRVALVLRAEAEGGEGEVALDDAALVPGAPASEPHRVGTWEVIAVGGGRAHVLAKADRVLASGVTLRAATATPGVAASEPSATGFALRAAAAGSLELVAELALVEGGVATLGAGGYIAHSGAFEREDATDLLLGKDNDLVRVQLARPTAVRGVAVGAASRITAALGAGDTARFQLAFDEERVQSQRLAREARFARTEGRPGEALAAWGRLLAEYPFDQALVDEAATARGELVREGSGEVRVLERELERAQFFRLVDLYDELTERTRALAARYQGSEVEANANGLLASIAAERATLAQDLDRYERQRLEAIAAFLDASESKQLASEVRAYLDEHFVRPAAGTGNNAGGDR